jgi:hypothetical protein
MVVPETVPQTYSMSVRPSSIAKQLKPERAVPPRTVAEIKSERGVCGANAVLKGCFEDCRALRHSEADLLA